MSKYEIWKTWNHSANDRRRVLFEFCSTTEKCSLHGEIKACARLRSVHLRVRSPAHTSQAGSQCYGMWYIPVAYTDHCVLAITVYFVVAQATKQWWPLWERYSTVGVTEEPFNTLRCRKRLLSSSFPFFGIEMKTCGLSGMRSPSLQCTHEASRDSFTLTEPFSQIGPRINMPCRTAGKCRNSSGLKSGEINVSRVSS